MRKSALPLEKLHNFVKFFFSNAKLSQQTTKIGEIIDFEKMVKRRKFRASFFLLLCITLFSALSSYFSYFMLPAEYKKKSTQTGKTEKSKVIE
jgi:cytochrome c-type biogenesis protein CcmE